MALTGLFWSFDWYRDGLYSVLGVENPRSAPAPQEDREEGHPGPVSGQEPLAFQSLLEIAGRELKYEGNYRVSLPDEPGKDISISKNKTGFFAPAAGDRLNLDPYTGAVTQKEVFSEKPFNERVARSVKALHVGNVYGTFSKIIYFLSCLIATSLPVTGTIIWINKLRKKAKRKAKASTGSKKERSAALIQ